MLQGRDGIVRKGGIWMGNNSGEAPNIATRMMEDMENGQYWRSNSESLAGMWTSDSPWGSVRKGLELFVKL